jgi:hypothetical protein
MYEEDGTQIRKRQGAKKNAGGSLPLIDATSPGDVFVGEVDEVTDWYFGEPDMVDGLRQPGMAWCRGVPWMGESGPPIEFTAIIKVGNSALRDGVHGRAEFFDRLELKNNIVIHDYVFDRAAVPKPVFLRLSFLGRGEEMNHRGAPMNADRRKYQAMSSMGGQRGFMIEKHQCAAGETAETIACHYMSVSGFTTLPAVGRLAHLGTMAIDLGKYTQEAVEPAVSAPLVGCTVKTETQSSY